MGGVSNTGMAGEKKMTEIKVKPFKQRIIFYMCVNE